MWAKSAEVTEMDASPSLLAGNLSKAGSFAAFASMEDVIVLNTKEGGKPNKISLVEKSVVYQVLVCEFNDEKFLVIANEAGCQVWDLNGEHLYFSLALTKELASSSEVVHQFCRGICADISTNSIIVGSSLGKLYMLSQKSSSEAKGSDRAEFHLQATVMGHKDPVHAIASNGSTKSPLACSSDDGGSIIIWTVESAGLEAKHKLPGTGYPVTSLRGFDARWFLSGDTTGKLRLVDANEGVVAADVGAHTRLLSGVDACGDRAVTVGEDGFWHVWKLKEDAGGSLRVEHEHSQRAGDDLLTGVVFADPHTILTVAYDSVVLKAWTDHD
ncbi:hypothetical protein ACHHYP_13175 [Achlya hypogyna]|uniref:WD repeat-containing protein 54 beta-propeller domain-containing protein n=1 Tax=Achlya hypogyna TaxID=1202772 RepID=A0A1V9YFW0_ACHHY|nr:hypothetical protein ACHHYP_13175 [Achlya hypogyna]